MKPCDNGVCAFGQTYANELRRRRPRCGDKWHMDEVFLTIRSERHSLWRAVDQDGNVLDILVQSRRNKKAAKRFFRQLRVWVTIRSARDYHQQADKLWSSETRDPAWRGAPPVQVPQQSSRELASTHTT